MEAGIAPAIPVQTHAQAFQILTTATTVLDNIKNNGNLLLELCGQCTNLCEIAQHTHARSEQILIHTLFKTILSHIQIIQSTLTTYTKISAPTDITNKSLIMYGLEIEKSLQQYVSLIWDKLKFPYSQPIRSLLLNILIIIQETSYLFQLLRPRSSTSTNYSKPTKTSKPSYISQVINPSPSSFVIDPILASLQQNYYYPLAAKMPTDEMDYDNNNDNVNQSNPQPPISPIKKVETSIDTIFDVLQEMEGEDPPIQSEFATAEVIAQQQANQVKASFRKHSFSIYRRIYTNTGHSTNSQLTLFKSFSYQKN